MGRFLLFVIVVGAVALYFTNPTTEEVQAKLGGAVPAELSGAMPSTPDAPSVPTDVPAAPDMPALPAAPADAPAPPADMPAPPADQPGAAPDAPAMPAAMPSGDMQLERKDYYLFSVYKVTVGGQQLPGCIVGIAKQAVPMTPDRCPA